MRRKRTNLLDEDLSKWTAGSENFSNLSLSGIDAAGSDSFFEKINRLSIELDKRLLKLEAQNQE